jgi:hypothetical protein
MQIKEHVEDAIKCLNSINWEKQSNLDYFSDLVDALTTIEEEYQSLCEDLDYELYHDRKDSCYDFGPNIEFQIEASDWHRISLILRKINPHLREYFNKE